MNTLSSGSGQTQMASPYEHDNELVMVGKQQIYTYKRLSEPCIIIRVWLLHVSATLLAILREMHYK